MILLLTLLIFNFSILTMELQPPMELEEKVALLDAFRCGTLKAEQQQISFQNNKTIYLKSIAHVSHYFNEIIASALPLEILLAQVKKAVFSDPRALDWQPLSLKKKEKLSRKLLILELRGKLGSGPFEELRISLLNALAANDAHKLNSVLKNLHEIRNPELAQPIEKVLDPGEELDAIE